MPQDPNFSSEPAQDSVRLRLAGDWTIDASRAIETSADGLVAAAGTMSRAILDLGSVGRLDTAGAWLIGRSQRDLAAKGIETRVERVKPEYAILLEEAHFRDFGVQARRRGLYIVDLLADIGKGVVGVGRDVLDGIAFLGEVVVSFFRTVARPASFRSTSLVYHIETIAFRSVPIVSLLTFLVGAIVAQQGIFQLSQFGASSFAADLIGILILRELGVMLTSIMLAGRSGSAITAELGSMKMREEIDALTVMGLRPVEVLIVPRLLALVISLPLLTFIANMSAIFGGLLVAWGYGGISPEVYLSRLQSAISLHTFLAGLIKAPFMALVIGLIAVVEGLAVQGSAESLGRQVTASVVKSIFMVIVVDGLFTMFFASIRF